MAFNQLKVHPFQSSGFRYVNLHPYSEETLKNLGVYGDLTFAEVPIDFIPYETDVLSLEMETAFRDLAVGHGGATNHPASGFVFNPYYF